jgi:3-oxoacyl-[acyl-carrier-protein] synthase II
VTGVVITGLGLVTAYGHGVTRFWRGLLSGRPALGAARRFDSPELRGECVGEVPDPAGGGRRAYLTTAVDEALADAGYPAVPEGCLVILVGQTPQLTGSALAVEPDLVTPVPRLPDGVRIAGGGPMFLTHACASAAFGVALAREMLDGGLADVALVAGATALNHTEYSSMRVVRAVSPNRARPFDRSRDGISVGEGGGAVVLETTRRAADRGRTPHSTVTGAACRVAGANAAASDQAVLTDCLEAAVAESSSSRVDYVHAHATGTAQGDAVEIAALAAVTGRLAGGPVPASSHKGAIGHLLHTSCFPSITAAVLALRTGILPGTPGLADPEPTEHLELLRASYIRPDAQAALVVSAGFGGNNAALLLAR